MAENWRMKPLPLAEWSALQEHFGELQLATGGPEELAMFVQGPRADETQDIYITGPGIEAIEAKSPGGWVESSAPSGGNLALLVGSGDPWEFFGIEKP